MSISRQARGNAPAPSEASARFPGRGERFQIDYLFLCSGLDYFRVPAFFPVSHPQREGPIRRLVFDNLLRFDRGKKRSGGQNGREERCCSHLDRSRASVLLPQLPRTIRPRKKQKAKLQPFSDRSDKL